MEDAQETEKNAENDTLAVTQQEMASIRMEKKALPSKCIAEMKVGPEDVTIALNQKEFYGKVEDAQETEENAEIGRLAATQQGMDSTLMGYAPLDPARAHQKKAHRKRTGAQEPMEELQKGLEQVWDYSAAGWDYSSRTRTRRAAWTSVRPLATTKRRALQNSRAGAVCGGNGVGTP